MYLLLLRSNEEKASMTVPWGLKGEVKELSTYFLFILERIIVPVSPLSVQYREKVVIPFM